MTAGLLCATGMVNDEISEVLNPAGPNILIPRILKRFTCDDLSGTFDIRMVVRLNLATGNTTARWNVVGGTGNYAGLKGNGGLVGTPFPAPVPSILDVYDGKLH